MANERGRTGGAEEAWRAFQELRAPALEAWIAAGRALAAGRARGVEDVDAGDRLMIAEASLQTAIVDFAAAHTGARENPTSLAIAVLRQAEAMLDAALAAGETSADIRGPRTPEAAAPPGPVPPRPPRPR
ncbi:MAG: hypothetical protein ABR573_01595 [Candidatus Dormibacteria bacterium]